MVPPMLGLPGLPPVIGALDTEHCPPLQAACMCRLPTPSPGFISSRCLHQLPDVQAWPGRSQDWHHVAAPTLMRLIISSIFDVSQVVVSKGLPPVPPNLLSVTHIIASQEGSTGGRQDSERHERCQKDKQPGLVHHAWRVCKRRCTPGELHAMAVHLRGAARNS